MALPAPLTRPECYRQHHFSRLHPLSSSKSLYCVWKRFRTAVFAILFFPTHDYFNLLLNTTEGLFFHLPGVSSSSSTSYTSSSFTPLFVAGQPTSSASPSATATSTSSVSPSATSTGTVSVTSSQTLLPQLWMRRQGGVPGDAFGSILASSTDAAYVVIATAAGGAPGAGGKVVIMKRAYTSSTLQQHYYRQIQELEEEEGHSTSFGSCVAISGDGSVLVVGDPNEETSSSEGSSSSSGSSSNSNSNSNNNSTSTANHSAKGGRIRIYARQDPLDDFVLVQVINGTDSDRERLGGACVLSTDGTTLVIGAPGAGRVYFYSRVPPAPAVLQSFPFFANPPKPFAPFVSSSGGLPTSIIGSTLDWGFGSRLSICGNGLYTVISAPGIERVYIYEAKTPAGLIPNNNNVGVIHHTLVRVLNVGWSTASKGSGFGSSTAISDDCRVIVVGQPGNSTVQVYNLWVNAWIDVSVETFTPPTVVNNNNGGSSTLVEIGAGVGINRDGSKIVVSHAIQQGITTTTTDYAMTLYFLTDGHGNNGASLVTAKEARVYTGYTKPLGWTLGSSTNIQGRQTIELQQMVNSFSSSSSSLSTLELRALEITSWGSTFASPSFYPLPASLSVDGTVVIGANLLAQGGEGEVMLRLIGTPVPTATSTATTTMTATFTPTPSISISPSTSSTASASTKPAALPSSFPGWTVLAGVLLGSGVILLGAFWLRAATAKVGGGKMGAIPDSEKKEGMQQQHQDDVDVDSEEAADDFVAAAFMSVHPLGRSSSSFSTSSMSASSPISKHHPHHQHETHYSHHDDTHGNHHHHHHRDGSSTEEAEAMSSDGYASSDSQSLSHTGISIVDANANSQQHNSSSSSSSPHAEQKQRSRNSITHPPPNSNNRNSSSNSSHTSSKGELGKDAIRSLRRAASNPVMAGLSIRVLQTETPPSSLMFPSSPKSSSSSPVVAATTTTPRVLAGMSGSIYKGTSPSSPSASNKMSPSSSPNLVVGDDVPVLDLNSKHPQPPYYHHHAYHHHHASTSPPGSPSIISRSSSNGGRTISPMHSPSQTGGGGFSPVIIGSTVVENIKDVDTDLQLSLNDSSFPLGGGGGGGGKGIVVRTSPKKQTPSSPGLRAAATAVVSTSALTRPSSSKRMVSSDRKLSEKIYAEP